METNIIKMQTEVEKCLGQRVKVDKIFDSFIIWSSLDTNDRYTSDITKTGRFKKKSVRLYIH